MDNDEKGKIFVGGLSWETTHANLMQYFTRFGEVVDCVVMKNSDTGRSRGFGFVTFADPAVVNAVLLNGPHTLDGRTIDPKPCNPRTLQKPKKGSGYPKVFLGGLGSNVTETDLRSFFQRYGRVMEVVIMYDQEKKKSRGFGFLSFETEESVNRCVADHYVNVNGKNVEIKRAEPRNNSEGTGNFQTALGMMTSTSYNQMGGPPLNQAWGTVPSPYQQTAYAGGMSYGPATSTQGWDVATPPPAVPTWGVQSSGYGVPVQPALQQGYPQYGATADSGSNWNNWTQEAVSTQPNNNDNSTAAYMAAGDMSSAAPPHSAPSNAKPTGNYSEYSYQGAAGDNYVVGPLRIVGVNNTYHPYRRS